MKNLVDVIEKHLSKMPEDQQGPMVSAIVDYLNKRFPMESMPKHTRDFFKPKPIPKGYVICPDEDCRGKGEMYVDEVFGRCLVQCSRCKGKGIVEEGSVK